MFRRVAIAFVLVAVGTGTAAIVFSAFMPSHQATGQVNTAASASEGLYICQPSGDIVDPICPIDTDGADETIFAATEDLLPGERVYQKIRVRNVSSEPWDILSIDANWTVVSDPGSDCATLPQKTVFVSGSVSGAHQDRSGSGPGVTVLGKVGGSYDNPLDGTLYDGGFISHGTVQGSPEFETRYRVSDGTDTVHVEPGDYTDLLLGLRLPTGTPVECVDVVWQLATTWTVQPHNP